MRFPGVGVSELRLSAKHRGGSGRHTLIVDENLDLALLHHTDATGRWLAHVFLGSVAATSGLRRRKSSVATATQAAAGRDSFEKLTSRWYPDPERSLVSLAGELAVSGVG